MYLSNTHKIWEKVPKIFRDATKRSRCIFDLQNYKCLRILLPLPGSAQCNGLKNNNKKRVKYSLVLY